MDTIIGLYIGRFQPFHNGHKLVVDTMLEQNENNLILIGVNGDDGNKNNPYSYAERLGFLSDIYKDSDNLSIYPLIDNPSDKAWIQQILGIGHIQKVNHIKLYCGSKKEDSAIKVIEEYKSLFEGKKLEIIEIDRNIIPISGTQVRHEMKVEGIESIENLIPKGVYNQLKKTG